MRPVIVYSSLIGGRILTTPEVRLLALASLAPWQQPDNTYAIHPHVLGFFGEQGGDSPQQSQPVTDNTSIYIQKFVNFGKTNRFFAKTHRWVIRHFRQQRELEQGVVGKCRSRPKMIQTARFNAPANDWSGSRETNPEKRNIVHYKTNIG